MRSNALEKIDYLLYLTRRVKASASQQSVIFLQLNLFFCGLTPAVFHALQKTRFLKFY